MLLTGFKEIIKIIENRRKAIKRKRFMALVKSGGLQSLRITKRDIEQFEFQRDFAKNYSGSKLYWERYDIQRQIQELFNSRNILKISKAVYKNRNRKARLAIPEQWESIFRNNVKLIDFRNDKLIAWFYDLNLAFKALVKTILILIKIIRWQLSSENVGHVDTFLIGHSRERLFQKAVDGEHSFVNWLNFNGFPCKAVFICSESDYFAFKLQCEFSHNSSFKKLIQCTILILCDFIQTDIPLRVKSRYIDQSIYCTLTKAFPQLFKNDRIFITESMSSRRPIWTYKSEFFECNVTYIEFSHVIEPNISNADEVISDRFNLFTYDEVIIASKFVEYKIQKNEFKFVKRINTNVLGVPWFSDCLVHKPNFVSRSIAVFDFEPKVFFGLSRLTELSLFSRNSMNEFLSPILKECQNLGITVYRKPKRFLDTKELYPESLDFLEDISKQPNYIEICSKVAPTSVMKEVMGVISMPPTSTALIAREKGVPSIYFDPFKKIMKNDVNLEGIEIMSTHVELRKWLHEVLESL